MGKTVISGNEYDDIKDYRFTVLKKLQKREVVDYLKKCGYNAIMDDGMPTVIAPEREYNQQYVKRIKKLLKGIGYEGSWSVKRLY